MKIRLAGIERESVVDGPGVRTVLFGQGCNRHCEGCHNKETWDLNGGTEYSVEDIITGFLGIEIIRGVTISGGEPFLQACCFAHIVEAAKNKGLDVVTYTGYTFDELMEFVKFEEDWWHLLCQTDYLIDGPFKSDKRDLSLAFRGSSNQRIIDVGQSIERGKIVSLSSWEEIVM